MRGLDRRESDGRNHPAAVKGVRRTLFVVAALVLAGAAAVSGIWLWVERSARDHIFERAEEIAPAKAELVLGSSRLVRNYVANPFFTNRIAAAATLFRAGKV